MSRGDICHSFCPTSTWLLHCSIRAHLPLLNLKTRSSFPHFPGIWNVGTYSGLYPTKPPQTLQQKRLKQRSRGDINLISKDFALVTAMFPEVTGTILGAWCSAAGTAGPQLAHFAKPDFELWSWLHGLWNCFCGPRDCELPKIILSTHTEPFMLKYNTRFKTHIRQMCRLMNCHKANSSVNNIHVRRQDSVSLRVPL